MPTPRKSNIVFVPVPSETHKWTPVIKEFTQQYLDDLTSLDDEAKMKLVQESTEILGDCLPPNTKTYSEAGLIVGYVQSGKTQSFTTIAALARDNGYGMVIVLTGITNLLKRQSIERLIDDLGLREYASEWRLFENPGAANNEVSNPVRLEFKSKVESWNRYKSGLGAKKPSLLVTVLKSKGRIQNLATLLSSLDLSEIPTLIIDDESDQASPNLKSSRNLAAGGDDESSTYGAIVQLRKSLPKHTYLQYTATPQANLLAAKSDVLSPNFARVITPGKGYTGGDFFFQTKGSPHIKIIPDSDTIDPKNLPDEPPESLLSSLRSFWLGAAISVVEDHKVGRRPATRSMMIQVSAQIIPQALFRKWTQRVKSEWQHILGDPTKASFATLISEFQETHRELSKTHLAIPTFEDCLRELQDAIDDTKVVEVNSDKDAEKLIEWFQSRFWILIGGLKLDRGFTVRGITTTYMPRTVAENGDTLQQRARFFGYHGSYAGLCRIYISNMTFSAYSKYLEHETELRASLIKHQGKPLSEWKRHFILDRSLKPTRAAVIGLPIRRRIVTEGWITPAFLHSNEEAIYANQQTFAQFIKNRLTSDRHQPYPQHWRDFRQGNKHELFTGIEADLVADFLENIHLSDGRDSEKIIASAIAIRRAIRKKELSTVDVVLMNGYSSRGLRGAKADPDKGLVNVFTGRNPDKVSDQNALIYIGDRAIHTDSVTLQLRIVHETDTLDSGGNKLDIPWFALMATPVLETSILEEIVD